jgi:hypothetical protein
VRRATALLRRANGLLPPGVNRPLGAGRLSASESRVVPEFGRVASRLAGHRVEVRCWSRSDWPRLLREVRELSVSRLDERTAGFTPVGGSRINLGPDGCAALGALVFGHARPSGSDSILYAAGVEVLSHESQHARGFADEAVTECRGIQMLRSTAAALGVSEPLAAHLAEVFWSHYDDEPEGYSTPRCHDGGPLDLHPSSSRWP